MSEDRSSPAVPPPEPGAPVGKDELDPDLISLRRPAPRVGMITAAAVVLGCIVLMIRLRHDLTFARAGDSPRTVTVADITAGRVAEDSYVTLTAPLERAAAVRARVTEANAGTRVAPVAGSDDHLWIALPGDAWSPAQHDELVTGRLRSMASVRFADAVRGYVARTGSPRFVTGAELRRARSASATGGPIALVDGGHLTVTGQDEIEIVVPDPARSIVVATFSSRLPDVKAWTTALATAAVIPAGTEPIKVGEETARWEVAGASAKLGPMLDAAGLWGARAEPATARVRVRFGELTISDDGVRAPSGTIPWSVIDVAAIWAPRTVPPDARVLLVDEKPDIYWYLPPVYVALGLFAALFTWALVLAVRRNFFDHPRVVPGR